MKTKKDVADWLADNLSYDRSGIPECPTCGHGGYDYWIDHKDTLVNNLMFFLGLWSKPGFPRGKIREEMYCIVEDAYVTGKKTQDAESLASEILDRLFGASD